MVQTRRYWFVSVLAFLCMRAWVARDFFGSTFFADAAVNMTLLATVVCLIFLALLFEKHIQANSHGEEESDEDTGEVKSS